MKDWSVGQKKFFEKPPKKDSNNLSSYKAKKQTKKGEKHS